MNDIFTYSQKNGSTIFTFPGRTKVLSTSPLNGGITTHLTHALNINCMNGDYECEMLGDTYEKDLMVHAQRLEINPQTATALSTAAWTELCAVETLRHQELSVQKQKLLLFPIFYLEAAILRKSLPAQAQTEL